MIFLKGLKPELYFDWHNPRKISLLVQVNLSKLHINSAKALMATKVAAGQHELTVVHRTHIAVFWERLFLVTVVISEL